MAVFLEIVRAAVAQKGMQAVAVVEHHDVVDDVAPGLFPCLVTAPMHPLRFQRSKKALHHRIIPAVALPAHAALDTVSLEQQPEGPAGILDTPVRVVDQLPMLRPRGSRSSAKGKPAPQCAVENKTWYTALN